MTTRTTRSAVLALLVAGALAAAGCGGSDDDAADGTTTRAATTAAPTTSAAEPATTEPQTTATAPVGPGGVAAGRAAFEAAPCSGCHAGLGTRAGFGPKLAGAGLTATQIETVIVSGRGQMPAGQAEGQELADIVAYVASLQ